MDFESCGPYDDTVFEGKRVTVVNVFGFLDTSGDFETAGIDGHALGGREEGERVRRGGGGGGCEGSLEG